MRESAPAGICSPCMESSAHNPMVFNRTVFPPVLTPDMMRQLYSLPREMLFDTIPSAIRDEQINVINDSVLNKTTSEITQNVINKTNSIFKDIKEIKYQYFIYDETKKYDAYKAEPHDVDVSIISTHENSSIALAYQPRNFVIYDEVYLKIYNKNKDNLTLNVIVNGNLVKNYTICDEYSLLKYEFPDTVNKLRIQLRNGNTTIFDTGKLTIIHKTYVQWYEDSKKETVSVEKGYLILSNFWYFLSGGFLTLLLCVIIARYMKKKKENEILVGW